MAENSLLAFSIIRRSMYLRRHGLKSRQESAEHRANHFGVFRDSGLEVKQYRYYDKNTISLDLDGMIEDLKVILSRISSDCRLLRMVQLSFCMLALIIQLALIQLKPNGKLSPKHAKQRSISYSSTWLISLSHQEILTRMLGPCDTL